MCHIVNLKVEKLDNLKELILHLFDTTNPAIGKKSEINSNTSGFNVPKKSQPYG